jgi:uncharacterized phage protein gp47/JayE
MGLSLAQLTDPLTTAEARAMLLAALAGRGPVTKEGDGSGSLSTSGAPVGAYQVLVTVTAAGELGTAAFSWSLDGGETDAETGIQVPASGVYMLGDTGLSVTFAAGPAGTGASFAAGDTFAFETATPTFPVTSWREGDVARTLVEIDAQTLSSFSTLLAAIARGGLLSTATGSWLTLLAREVYAVERNAAVATRGTVLLTAAAEAGPYTLAPGQLWFASTAGLRFQAANAAQLTLPKGGTLQVPVQAERGGAPYNVAIGTITSMVTQLAGVTCSNPDAGGGAWISTTGVDEESDEALRTRCESRWPELGSGSPGGTYDLWARTASSAITRSRVTASGTVAGQVDVVVAGPSGPVGSGEVTAAQAYIEARAPLTSTPVVTNATGLDVTVTAELQGKSQYETAALAAAALAIGELLAATPIGGTLFRSAVIATLQKGTKKTPITGVENVILTAPAGDTGLTSAQVARLAAGSPALTWSNT